MTTTDTTTSTGGAEPLPPGTPEELAERLWQILDEFETTLGEIKAHDTREARLNSAVTRFAPGLIAKSISVLKNNPEFAADNPFDAEKGQKALDEDAAMQRIKDRLSSLTTNVVFTTNGRLAVAGEAALAGYQWADRRSKRPDGAALRPFVEEMRLIVKRAINHRPQPSTPPPAPPSRARFLGHSLASKAAQSPADAFD